jgi:hypothetical protein
MFARRRDVSAFTIDIDRDGRNPTKAGFQGVSGAAELVVAVNDAVDHQEKEPEGSPGCRGR